MCDRLRHQLCMLVIFFTGYADITQNLRIEMLTVERSTSSALKHVKLDIPSPSSATKKIQHWGDNSNERKLIPPELLCGRGSEPPP